MSTKNTTKQDKKTGFQVKSKSTPQSNQSINRKGIINNLLSNILGENRELAKYWKVVEQIENLEGTISKLSDKKLQAKTDEFRKILADVPEKDLEKKLKEILPEAFAVLREATVRTIGKRHFPVQLIGGMVLNDGRVAEMKTGEGKTLVAPLAAYLNALVPNAQVHIVTVNDYLARVGASWMGIVFDYLGLSVGVIQPGSSFYFKKGYQSTSQDAKKRELGKVDDLIDTDLADDKTVVDVENLVPCDKKRAYFDDEKQKPVEIVYAVNSELGFDYLRDNMVQTVKEINQSVGHQFAVIDEVDSILIDEARTPLIISSQDNAASDRYYQFSKLVTQLTENLHFTKDEKRKVVTVTEVGVEQIEVLLGVTNLYENPNNVTLIHHLDTALKAKALFNKEKQYVVKDGEIVIVDEFTGRLMFGRRYSDGLHQALEAKEGLNVQAEAKTTATITYQNFFRQYKKLSGMTGTASTESEELYKIYKLLVVTIPTNKPVVRDDKVDKMFKTQDGKFKALVRDIAAIHKTGQPILIGTTSIENNEKLSSMLSAAGIEHQLLNAKNHEKEALIIASAGKKGSVTIATNIAGRGVDIILGGNRPDDENKLEDWKKDHEEVLSLGGLYVIGTERHESRRIDNQLRGRSGRQGDPGKSIFYISFDDYILRVFGGEKVNYYSRILPVSDDEAIQFNQFGWLAEQAQKKIEGQNFDIRKYVTEFDDVINKQRTVIYEKRRKILFKDGFEWEKELSLSIFSEITRIFEPISKKMPKGRVEKQFYTTLLQNAVEDLNAIVKFESMTADSLYEEIKKYNFKAPKLIQKYHKLIVTELESKWKTESDSVKAAIARVIFIRAIDVLWTEHLVSINSLQDSTRLRYLAQKDPLTEFKDEGMKLFKVLLTEIDKEISQTIFKADPVMLSPDDLEE